MSLVRLQLVSLKAYYAYKAFTFRGLFSVGAKCAKNCDANNLFPHQPSMLLPHEPSTLTVFSRMSPRR